MEYITGLLIVVGIYAILATSLDLLVGHAGLLSVAQAAFYGIGAYTAALLAVSHGAPAIVGILLGMVLAALASLALSVPTLRLHDDYFFIAAFAFQVIFLGILSNWMSLTQGPLGITGIPELTVAGIAISSRVRFLCVTAMFAAFAHVATDRIATSPLGRALRGIREDEEFTQALGKDTVRIKVSVICVSAALAALAGSLYAHYMSFIDPSSFTVMESILVVAMVIIGGAASRWGPLIGAAVLVMLPEGLRFLGLPTSIAANLRQIIYGSLLVLLMLLRPNGLVGRYDFER